LNISFIAGVKPFDKVAEKAGIFLGSETGLQYYIFMPFDICFKTLGRLT
jgi:hypothetical protein